MDVFAIHGGGESCRRKYRRLKGFVQILQKAMLNKEVDESRSAEQRARYLVMGISGLRIYAQSNNDPQQLAELAEQLLDDVYR